MTGLEETIVENIIVTKPVVSAPEENVLLDEVLDSNIVEESSNTLKRSLSNSSFKSFHSQEEEEKFLDVHTSFLVVENLLQELFAKGEENLARQLAEFYIASRTASFSSEKSWPFKLDSPTTEKPPETNPPQIPLVTMDVVPMTKMQQILAARYAPLLLPNPLNAMPTGDYQ